MLNAIDVSLPKPVFQRLERVARQNHRSIPDTVDALITEAEETHSLHKKVDAKLALFSGLPNDKLVLLAQNVMPREDQVELADLNDKAQRTGKLMPDEQERQAYLLDYYQQAIIHRAYCLEVLRQRGYDVSLLLELPNEPAL